MCGKQGMRSGKVKGERLKQAEIAFSPTVSDTEGGSKKRVKVKGEGLK